MGNGVSTLFPCLNRTGSGQTVQTTRPGSLSETYSDEALGHSFCYVRNSNRFSSPSFLSPNTSLRFSPTRPGSVARFKTISGASVSANAQLPKTVLRNESIYEEGNSQVLGFESSASFFSLPLQMLPKGENERAFFMSGPMERGALSGPIEQAVPFSAPLNGGYSKKRGKNVAKMAKIRKAFSRSFTEKKRPWVVPVREKDKEKEEREKNVKDEKEKEKEKEKENVEWALGAAGEDRVHVVVSEELGWLFVGIYDGFNGPDGPEFLMGNLYKTLFSELEGLFWDNVVNVGCLEDLRANSEIVVNSENVENSENVVAENDNVDRKRVTFREDEIVTSRRRQLWEYLAEEDDREEHGLDLSGSERFAFSVHDVGNGGVNKGSMLISKLKDGFVKRKEIGKLFSWRFKEKKDEGVDHTVDEREEERVEMSGRKRKMGSLDHNEVLSAMSRALETTELAYLDMTDKFLDQNPELALMGSCLLVVLMREEDVYVMNVGDSRAIVAQFVKDEAKTSVGSKEVVIDDGNSDIVEDKVTEDFAQNVKLCALQLSTDHSTSIEEEIIRIKNEHPDDSHCIVNDRVKGRLKVTRAFGAGFLKQPKLNDAMLEMFRNEYIGTAPYLSCSPSLCHHKLCPSDQFLVLSSDGLYQYFSNREVVVEVENFMEKFPDGDPAQHLIEELLLRAAKKAGMDLHELLDIPQGDRRKYHDDVTVMIISLEGRIWKSSGKYL